MSEAKLSGLDFEVMSPICEVASNIVLGLITFSTATIAGSGVAFEDAVLDETASVECA